jgi:SnoaL-like domain
MNDVKTKSTRRAFFLHGGAVLGAGVATTAGAAALTRDPASSLQRQLESAQDRDAIRRLHGAFTSLIEGQGYAAAAALFSEQGQLHLSGVSANGSPAIRDAFEQQYRQQRADVIHKAYRHKALHSLDAVTLSEDGLHAAATFHVEAELCMPLRDDCTVARMARLQGHVADRHWESGRFDATYVKTEGEWKITSLSYRSA